ncbi:MAG: DUF3916 domain-containing protein [Bacillota bacterium]
MYFYHPRSTYKKKIRGVRRKMDSLIKNIDKYTEAFPEQDGDRYWHLHLPTSQKFIDSYKTPLSVRRKCIQILIERVKHLNDIKPYGIQSKIVAAINLPFLWDSQIIIFFDQNYYKNFFDRNSEDQKWTLLQQNRNIKKELGLIIPETMQVRGYLEELNNEDDCYVGELWFIGELA